ncbi:MAG: hypothetical protein H6657_23460 [Ardenticatenaceae bacterium]|nr:hypothetical protein [Ardenticatenaceae bacterium]
MNFSRDLTLLANGRWPKSERDSLSYILNRLNDDLFFRKRFGEAKFRFWLDRLQDKNVDGIEVWQVDGRSTSKEAHSEPFGIIELFPRADEFLDVNFFHAANSPDSDATYDYLWQLGLALRRSGMAPISNFPGPISRGFKKVEAMVIVPDSVEAVKDVLLNINEQKTYLDLSGEFLAGAINVHQITSRTVHLALDVLSITPKLSDPSKPMILSASELVAIQLQKKGKETILNLYCRHDAMVPYAVDLLNRFKPIWREEKGLWQAIEAEEQRLLQLDDMHNDSLETAVSTEKMEYTEVEIKHQFTRSTRSINLPGIKGTIPKFVRWVGEVSGEHRFQQYPIGEGAKIMVLPLTSPWSTDHPFPILELSSRIITPKPEEYVFESGNWVIRLWVMDAGEKRIDLKVEYNEPAIKPYFDWLLERLAISWPGAKKALKRYKEQGETAVAVSREESPQMLQAPDGRKGGRPQMPKMELIYRLAKVQEAIELRDKENLTWAECASKIKWRYGVGPSGLAQLADARRRLEALQTYDPDNILIQVHDYRQREKKET